MVSTRKIRQSNRTLLNQFDDFGQNIIICSNASERREKITVDEGTSDRDFTVGTSGKNLVTNENTVSVKTLESCFDERIEGKMSNVVETVEDRI